METNDRHGLLRRRSAIWRSPRDGDFEEQDVWDVLDGHGNHQYTSKINRTSQSPLRNSPRVTSRTTDCCSITCRESKGVAIVRQHSAPVNVPDWSRIQSKKSKEATTADDDNDDGDDDEVGGNGSDENLSPEEYFRARNQSPSFSVVEGNGRKLKGRDLSRVRNAVLKKTGFLE